MCRLQFSSAPPAQPGPQLAEGEALEALLALSGDSGYDLLDVAETQPAGSSTGTLQPSSRVSSDAAASSRYHCPYPGCKRSFAELWRLKVHYRAPPNIRGSGKERGHGMRLTHCPKCGAALKVGGHHVKCAAVTKEPGNSSSAAGRRNRKMVPPSTAPRTELIDSVMQAAVPAEEPAMQLGQQTGCTEPAAPGEGNSVSHYLRAYGLTAVGQQEVVAGGPGAAWPQALHQQQHEQLQEAYAQEAFRMSDVSKAADGPGGQGVALSLQRVPSSDDSSSSRMVEGASSTGSGAAGRDRSGGPSSSSGSGAPSDDMELNQQQQQYQQLQLQPLDAAGMQMHNTARPIFEARPEAPQVPQHEQQLPQAGDILWQHMLLQHLQQHVQPAPGFSLPELIQVAAALFGSRVDTLVTAFGLGTQGRATGQDQAQMVQLAAALRQGEGAQ